MRISDWSSDVCSSDLIVDDADFSMFVLGTSQLTPEASHILSELAKAVALVPNQLMIRGHTDAAPWSAGSGTNNWRLSVERAEVSRQYLRSEEPTSELQYLMRISYAVFCLKKKQ